MTVNNSYNLVYYYNVLHSTINSGNYTFMNQDSTNCTLCHLNNVNSGSTNLNISSTRLIFTPGIIGNFYVSPVVSLPTSVPTSLYFKFTIVNIIL